MWLARLQFGTKLQRCIRMGITIFKVFIWGGISLNIHSEINVLQLRSCVTIKLNSQPYIWRYNTSPNENVEYSYPLIISFEESLVTISKKHCNTVTIVRSPELKVISLFVMPQCHTSVILFPVAKQFHKVRCQNTSLHWLIDSTAEKNLKQ